ncbi:CBL-interacting protein kinase 18 [Psilocybe cubensis]|uniref:CBL-interacting protein kinase 18 n=2 Tax=Psilocybe cubensis TaxID=181762 RepID=A0ACB8H7N9_PSICU|nr:CBL-interacting protein kinase 18 [Psilocybe cubensis]KAH9483657.1 CBL-interacting protein kinase 18 [Psilocybe cubensis]
MASSHLECPAATGGSSLRSRSSGSSTSSLSSTFSDLTSSTSASSSSPPNLKTNAFFAWPFSTRPPSPTPHPPATPAQSKPRSLTAEFFGTPVRPPSPPASSISTKHTGATPHLSRIFPSRYTSVSERSPDFSLNILNLDSVTDETPKFNGHVRTPSTGSSSSFSSSSFHEPRLPTPPPSHERTPQRDDTLMQGDFPPTPRQEEGDSYDELTPRPADRQPGLLRFERDLILERQARQQKLSQTPKPPSPEPVDYEDVENVDEEPRPGSIISLPSPEHPSSHLPISPLSLTFTIASPSPSLSSRPPDRGTPTPTNDYSTSSAALKSSHLGSPDFKPLPSPPPSSDGHDLSHTPSGALADSITTQTPPHSSSLSSVPLPPPAKDADNHTQVPKLRLLRSLGHGAFSAVWLAEDLSRVPLTLVSKKSVRDLRRRASGRDKAREREREREQEREREKDEEMAMDNSVAHDGGEKLNANSSTTGSVPNRNRIREGLMNMLSFSRSATHGSGASSATSPLSSRPSPVSPNSTTGFDNSDEDAGGALSRNSSVRSAASSFKGPSRAASLRLAPPPHQQDLTLSRDSSLKKFRDRVRGTRPAYRLGRAYLDERHGEMGEPRDVDSASASVTNVSAVAAAVGGTGSGSRDGGMTVSDAGNDGGEVGLSASLSRQSSLGHASSSKGNGRLVAVKMTPRRANAADVGQGRGGAGITKQRLREEEERTRVGFVREVEVLKHISHPNITPLLAHLSTASHHILVLPYLPGGDLLGLVNNDVAWGMLGESVLRRIWCEICKAVGWMHGVGLVHRDIKLENILLTTTAFSSLTPTSPRPTLSTLPAPPAPFIKLTDFGLSRFVEIDANGEAELLSTRCGSEAYAAPELVTGGGGSGGGVYDARRTDAWACGVVLYALVGRQLPFGEGVVVGGSMATGSKIGGERGKDGGVGRRATAADRRHWLMRIAKGEWEWPGGDDVADEGDDDDDVRDLEHELVGARLCKSRGARRIVSRLLVRDPKKRARVGDLWDDAWMQGGEDEAWWREKEMRMRMMRMEEDNAEIEDWVSRRARQQQQQQLDVDGMTDDSWSFYGPDDSSWRDLELYDTSSSHLGLRINGEDMDGEDGRLEDEREEEQEEDDEDEEEGGCLFDHEGIDSITRQEVI